jgi:hypothetical protein
VLTRAREEGGFSVVEAAVAGGLLLIAIFGGISVFDSSRRESSTGERQEVAALHAQAEIERMRDVPYSELGIDPAEGWQASTAPGDPTNRVGGTTTVTFRAGESLTEDVAYYSENGKGIDPYSSSPVEVDGIPLDLNVYRFISWRDEECPVADLTGLTGSLATFVDEPETLTDGLLGSGSVLNQLLGPLFDILNPIVQDRLGEAEALLSSIDPGLEGLASTIGGIEEVDPCDADVETLDEVEENLEPLSPLLTELDSKINAYYAGCTKVLGVIVACPGSTSSLYTNLSAAITNLEAEDVPTTLAELTASLDEIDATNHTHNTKRLTVAVVLAPKTGSGPSKPVWATSVVSDPDEGLLSSP